MKQKSLWLAMQQTWLALLLGVVSWVAPKRKLLGVFFPIHEKQRFSGNLKAVYLELRAHAPEIECLWVTADPEVHRQMQADGLAVRYSRRPPVWLLARAQLVLIDSYVKYLLFSHLRVGQVWHGVGYKRVGSANERNRGLKRVALWLQHRQYVFVLASSASDRDQKREIFEGTNAVITGSPRNDALLLDAVQAREAKRRLGLEGYTRVVLYAPTYRDVAGKQAFTADFWARAQAEAARHHTAIIIKKHPLDRALQVPGGLSHVRDVSHSVDDVQSALAAADVLITDYSSIATDFALKHLPILFYTYDFAEYQPKSRGFFFDLKEVLPGPFVADEGELLRMTFDTAWFQEAAYPEKFDSFVSFFHQYRDAQSSTRAAALVRHSL